MFFAGTLLITCEKIDRNNPWDAKADLDPNSWAPENFEIELISITERKLTWEFGDHNIEGFKIEREQGDGNWIPMGEPLPIEARSWTDETVKPDTNLTYTYRLVAFAGKNTSASRNVETAAIFPPPSNFKVESITDVSYKLSWQVNSVGEEGFRIDRRTDHGTWTEVYGEVGQSMTSFVDTNVFLGKSLMALEYRVYAYYGDYVSAYAYEQTEASLTAPSNLQITQHNLTSVTLNWNDNNTSASGFRVERKYTASKNHAQNVVSQKTPTHLHSDSHKQSRSKPIKSDDWHEIGITTDNVFEDNDFQLNTQVDYRVSAFEGTYHSAYAEKSFDSSIPQPTNLEITINSISSVSLSWDDNSLGEEGFKIDRKLGDDDWEVGYASVSANETSYIDNDVDLDGNHYLYRVYAYYSSYHSDYDEAVYIPLEVTTNEATNFTPTSATSGGYVVGSHVDSRGIAYGTSANPGITGSTVVAGSGEGSFTTNITGLNPLTTYHVRAYATNNAGTVYGESIMFTTIDSPIVTTGNITNIATTSATGSGNVTSDGGVPVTARGLAYGTSPNPTISGSTVSSGSGTGSFTANMTGLSPLTTYHVRAYATNNVGTAYGENIMFTTIGSPTVTTGSITNITSSSATGGGNVTSDGGAPITARGLAYGTSPNPDISGSTVSAGSGTGNFTANITGLTPNTTYHVRAFATNSAGTEYGNNVTFKTLVHQCGTNISFIYKGQQVTYGTVLRGGRCWMDRNLGASRVPTSSTDSQGYGDLFQWGRLDDGHQNRASSTTTTLSNTDVPGHGNYIRVVDSPNDWRSPQNSNLWQGTNGINNPCPPGWRVPTEAELNAERLSWTQNNPAGAYASTLKWPVGGYRTPFGDIFFSGSTGGVWSSSVSGTSARRLAFYSGDADMGSNGRAFGVSVRCVRNL